MPIHQLLRMGRGAVITLDSAEGDEVEILANDLPIARGVVVVNGDEEDAEEGSEEGGDEGGDEEGRDDVGEEADAVSPSGLKGEGPGQP